MRALPALLALGALAACGAEPSRPSFLVLVLDGARPEHVAADRRSPLAAFGGEATRFERAWSSSTCCLAAHASLLTGLAPGVHRATQRKPALDPRCLPLAEQLAGVGWRTAGFVTSARLAAARGLERGFERFEHAADEERAAESAVRWLEERAGSPEPLFLLVGLGPRDPRALERELLRLRFRAEGPQAAQELALLGARQEAELALSEQLAQRVLEAFARARSPERCFAFVLSDHGTALGEEGTLGHGLDLSEPSARIALLARGPGFERGRVDARLAQLVDVPATVLAAAELVLPGAAKGLDLRAEPSLGRVLLLELDLPALELRELRGLLPPKELERARRALVRAHDGRHALELALDARGRVLEERPFLLESAFERAVTAELPPEALARLRTALEAR